MMSQTAFEVLYIEAVLPVSGKAAEEYIEAVLPVSGKAAEEQGQLELGEMLGCRCTDAMYQAVQAAMLSTVKGLCRQSALSFRPRGTG